MKSQITHSAFLVILALFICTHSNINKAQINNQDASTKNKETKTVITNGFSNSASVCCIYCSDEHAMPAIPEPNGDHEFHSFHVKDKHAKHTNLFKNIANKMIKIIYYLIVLIVYMPFKH
jgi:hypothetical protein